MNENAGAKVWLIPDGYYPEKSNGYYPSHEAICVLNTGKVDAQIEITLFFEDRDKLSGFFAVCKAERTNHIRLDKLKDQNGQGIPRGVPYAAMVNSNVPVIVQYSRLDSTRQKWH